MTLRVTRNIGLVFISVMLGACAPGSDHAPRVIGGDADKGRVALAQYECGVCHVIPGIPDAVGKVGPALDDYSRRSYVAGKFPNQPETLVRWIVDAPSMAPQTAMPAIAMSQQEARHMAAYLYERRWP
ncbi:MAG: c-type cytochrome [Pseudomonadota bacterium]|nr:c-type cytochrome [Pseudomonadota bacterium]